MAANDEPYSTIFASLKHPIRRSILRMLSKETMSFSEMLEVLGVSSSILTYHLENLGELVGKTSDGKYRLSSFGEAAMSTMIKVEDIPATALQQSAETKPKKMNKRSIALALGTICIILIASLGGAMAYCTMTINSKDATINKLNATMANEINTIASLNANITNLTNERNQLQTWLDRNETLLNPTQANNTNLQNQIDSLNSNVTNLQNQVNNFHIGSTENSTVWVNNENVYASENWGIAGWGEYVPSAGYVSVRVSSNNNSTYVALFQELLNSTNTYLWWNPDYQISVGFGGTVVFPVLPTSMIGIRVGNSFGRVEATQTVVTITYYC